MLRHNLEESLHTVVLIEKTVQQLHQKISLKLELAVLTFALCSQLLLVLNHCLISNDVEVSGRAGKLNLVSNHVFSGPRKSNISFIS